MVKKKAKKTKKRYSLLTDGVTQSLLKTFINCSKHAEYVLDSWHRERGSEALVFGSMTHELIEKWYDSKSIPIANADEYVTPEKIIKAAEKKWRKEFLEGGTDAQQTELMIAWGHILFPEYCEFWNADDKKKEWVELEGVFGVDFDKYHLKGRCDGLYELNGKLWLLETKTTSRISEDTLSQQLAFDFQNLFYVTAKSIELDRPISGVLYNMIRKPSLKLKKTETIADYITRVRADVAGRPEWYFVRFEIAYPQAVQKRFQKELLIKLDKFNDWQNGIGETIKNEAACCGKWNCEFLDACASNSMAGYKQTRKLFGELED